ncbi:MAG: hypothetical protein M1820_002502 [Bogoriella megaspora]|nr:MAG: hypothetical protein M1820_002502 [Bogoriella megaspora]
MRYSAAIVVAAFASGISAHGVIKSVQGANGVTMPGLSVIDGTPRDCATPACGSEADTSIIRDNELGTSKASALGRTKGGGAVDPAKNVAAFMGTAAPPTAATQKRGLLDSLLGGGGGSNAPTTQGTKTAKGTTENGVAASAGQGKTAGLPTTDNTGAITMTFHQVNQDGAGALSADIDPTSGGTDPNAFQKATVMQDVPGLGIGGLSAATTTDFPVKVAMPQGMTCGGTVAGVQNVCIVRMRNQALAGPFGGSAAFTQSPAAQKRAIEYNLRKRHFARGILDAPEEESE